MTPLLSGMVRRRGCKQRFAGPCLAIVVAVVVVIVVIVIVVVVVVVVVPSTSSSVVGVFHFPSWFPLLFYIDFPCLTLSHRLGFVVLRVVVSVFLPFALFGT